nr:receptor-like kinase LIP1 isoform X2 [Aegilops tauschii subsp. strangulata]
MVGKGMVAVKKLSKTFGVHENKFHKEVECLVKAKHKNIVRFLGYCSDTQGIPANHEGKFVMAEVQNWLLCFEFASNGSLDKYINDAFQGLECIKRYQIITGICEGLLHLHEKRILHLDLKPANILLDDHMVPKITDFGLSRCLDKEQTRTSTMNPCVSLGYSASESFAGKFTFASDIYSLGVIIVEILTGEKGYPEEEGVVKTWMNRLEGSNQWETQLEQVRVCIKIGMECIDSNPKKRPVAHHINNRFHNMTSIVETGTSGSSVEQHAGFLKEQYCQEIMTKLSSEYLGKDIKEHAETEELAEYVGTPKEDQWQQGREQVPRDQWGAQDKKQNFIPPQGASISSSSSGLLYKLNNLDIFNTKARRNYVRYGGLALQNVRSVKLFKKGVLMPFLKEQNLIGKGGFGEVYRGLVGGVQVVVRKVNSGRVLCTEQFANEVIIQSEVIHTNIVRLIGCCLEVDAPMLVYEFVSRGSLDDILHSNKVPLNLDLRLSIAAQSSQGLAYMHSHANCKILHGDFRPANILLDDKFVPKITDFGMSRMAVADYGRTGIIVDTVYTAYTDPVYIQKGLLTEKSDVYSFGVVMLELLTRKKATHADNNSLVRNFLDNHKQRRKSTELFDKEISVAGDLELLDYLTEIAVECLNLDVDERPTMTEVAMRLFTLYRPRRQVGS